MPEIKYRKDIIESTNPEMEGYKKIKPSSGITLEEAKDYWNRILEQRDTGKAENKSAGVHSVSKQDVKENSDNREKKGVKEPEQNSASEQKETREDTNEGKELTEEEINEMQKAAIKEALEKVRNGEKLTTEELGNLGEMMMDQYYISKGYKPLNKHRVTSLDDKKSGFRTGIDGVYEKTNPDGTKTYVIVDAKYNKSQLNETIHGKQLSDTWIDKNLDNAVGKEKADEIRDAYEDNPDLVKREVYHIDPNVDENGNIHTDTQEVDSEGNKVGDKTIVEYFDEDGNRIDPSPEK